uniref:Uncharacterized protein n=1 Tax=Rhizophora mucronata TaxID=61149 RepID=A0A2P2P273_RHIMU
MLFCAEQKPKYIRSLIYFHKGIKQYQTPEPNQ